MRFSITKLTYWVKQLVLNYQIHALGESLAINGARHSELSGRGETRTPNPYGIRF